MRRPFMQGPVVGHAWVGPVFLFLIVVALIVGAILITRTIMKGLPLATAPKALPPTAVASAPQPPVDGPLQILELRFARGEIDEQEFRARRDVLRS